MHWEYLRELVADCFTDHVWEGDYLFKMFDLVVHPLTAVNDAEWVEVGNFCEVFEAEGSHGVTVSGSFFVEVLKWLDTSEPQKLLKHSHDVVDGHNEVVVKVIHEVFEDGQMFLAEQRNI